MVQGDNGRGPTEISKNGMERGKVKKIARYRTGHEMRGGWYWGTEEERRCRVCVCVCVWGGGDESWEYVLDRYSAKRGEERTVGERIREILNEGGEENG